MVVKNLNKTMSAVCSCGSWLNHWRRFGTPGPAFEGKQACSVRVCSNPIEVGALVQKEVLEGMKPLGMVGDASWYVIPLCGHCQRKSGVTLQVEDDCGLAPTNLNETCGMDIEEDRVSRSA
jgi:hypothetical protein